MLPGNTVLRKAKRDMKLGSHTVAAGSILWLYPNAVHLDEGYFPKPKAFCPMRLLNGNLERMSDEFELVTFGHGQKRCIGEKMARAMIITFLASALPNLDAEAPDTLPDDGFFDLIPASELRLYNLRARPPTPTASGDDSSASRRAAQPVSSPPAQPSAQPSAQWSAQWSAPAWVAVAGDQAGEAAADLGREIASMGRDLARETTKMGSLVGRMMLWELWLALWQTWTKTTAWREKVGKALWREGCDGVGAVAERVSRVVRLERMLAAVEGDRDGGGGGAGGEVGREGGDEGGAPRRGGN